jgi:multicomponent Na+:H+ antiporter subunit G
MSDILQLLATFAVIVGTLFSITGVVGFHRLPDVYTRLHATGKVGIFGVVLLTIAAALATPLAWSRAIVLIVLLLIAGPITAHALGSAAYRMGIPLRGATRDDLAQRAAQQSAAAPSINGKHRR